MCYVLMINFLIIMVKALCTLGLKTIDDKKINQMIIIVKCLTFDKHFGFIFVATS